MQAMSVAMGATRHQQRAESLPDVQVTVLEQRAAAGAGAQAVGCDVGYARRIRKPSSFTYGST